MSVALLVECDSLYAAGNYRLRGVFQRRHRKKALQIFLQNPLDTHRLSSPHSSDHKIQQNPNRQTDEYLLPYLIYTIGYL